MILQHPKTKSFQTLTVFYKNNSKGINRRIFEVFRLVFREFDVISYDSTTLQKRGAFVKLLEITEFHNIDYKVFKEHSKASGISKILKVTKKDAIDFQETGSFRKLFNQSRFHVTLINFLSFRRFSRRILKLL